MSIEETPPWPQPAPRLVVARQPVVPPAPALAPALAPAPAPSPEARIRHRARPLRRIRSTVVLILTAVLIGTAMAAVASLTVWGISVAIRHATTS